MAWRGISQGLYEIGRFSATLAIALAVGAIFIQLTGREAGAAYLALLESALGSRVALADSLAAATPLILTGLATAIAFRGGVFNVGVEGSLYIGAFAAAWVGFAWPEGPAWILLPGAILAGGLAGSLWGLIPGSLKAWMNVDEIVSTIMMNYIAIAFTSYLVNYPFAVPGLANAMSPPIAPAIHLPRLLPPSQLHLGFVMALLCVLGVGVLFARTTWGFELSLHGMNPVFVRWAGIRAPRVILTAMGLSGFLGGLAGALQVLGIHYRFIANFSPGYGYDGIAIALLGRTTALGVLAGALLFGILRNGASGLELFAGIPLELVRILEAVIILLVTAEPFMRWRTSKVKEA
jgi:ABC-type uncharacterized transport system permease subunit